MDYGRWRVSNTFIYYSYSVPISLKAKVAVGTVNGISYSGADLDDGNLYYSRLRLSNLEGMNGPWRYMTFRLNSVPAKVSNANRTPANSSSIADATPQMVWEVPSDADSDPLHFQIETGDSQSYGDSSVPNVNNLNNYTWLSSFTAPSAGTVSTVTCNFGAGVSGNVTFKHMRNTGGNTFSFIAQSSSMAIVSGESSYAVHFSGVLAGDSVGYILTSGSGKSYYASGGSGTSYYLSLDHTSGSLTYNYYGSSISLSAAISGSGNTYHSESFIGAGGGFEWTTESGAGARWLPFPEDGVPPVNGTRVRFTIPSSDLQANQTWFWSVIADDGFEYGPYSDTWSYIVGRSYTISGTLKNTTDTAQASKSIKIAHNGVLLGGVSDTTDGSGVFDLTTNAALKVGDILTVFVDGDTEKAARVFQFDGDSMTGIGLVFGRGYAGPTLAGDPLNNSDFAADSLIDADIPWTETSGNIAFASGLDGSDKGVWVSGQWDMSGDLDGTTALDTRLYVESSGELRTQGFDASFYSFENDGLMEVLAGSILTIDGTHSYSYGQFIMLNSTLDFNKSGSSRIDFECKDGSCYIRNSAFQDQTLSVARVKFGNLARMFHERLGIGVDSFSGSL